MQISVPPHVLHTMMDVSKQCIRRKRIVNKLDQPSPVPPTTENSPLLPLPTGGPVSSLFGRRMDPQRVEQAPGCDSSDPEVCGALPGPGARWREGRLEGSGTAAAAAQSGVSPWLSAMGRGNCACLPEVLGPLSSCSLSNSSSTDLRSAADLMSEPLIVITPSLVRLVVSTPPVLSLVAGCSSSPALLDERV